MGADASSAIVVVCTVLTDTATSETGDSRVKTSLQACSIVNARVCVAREGGDLIVSDKHTSPSCVAVTMGPFIAGGA